MAWASIGRNRQGKFDYNSLILPPLPISGSLSKIDDTKYNHLPVNQLQRNNQEAHFNSLPARYREYTALRKPKDVLLHRRLLAGARDPEFGPAVLVQLLENPGPKSEITEIEEESNHRERYYEVIFSTINKPRILSQLSDIVSDVGANIRVAHFFSTTDDYCLVAFEVDGWPQEAHDLWLALRMARCQHSRAVREQHSGMLNAIDSRLIKLRERVGSGPISNLYIGGYFGETVAVKIFAPKHNEPVKQIIKELTIMSKYQHRNVVHFIGVFEEFPAFFIITEHMPGGRLYEYLKKNHGVKLTQLLKFAIDACKGMEYMHQNNIIHRDLKAANLLVGTDNVVKVAEFGVSRRIPVAADWGILHSDPDERNMTAETGTYRWMAPEVLSRQPYGLKADVYSFGIVLWELVTAEVPYQGRSNLEVGLGVMKAGLRPEIPHDINPKYSDLMQRCWATNPDDRPTFSKIRAELEQLLQEIEENAEVQ